MKNTYKFTSVILASTIFLGACSNPLDSLADDINNFFADDASAPEEQSTEETEADTAEESDASETASTESDAGAEDGEVETIDYSHLMGEGEETTLSEGTHEVGDDIPVGRYLLTADSGFGNLVVHDEEERLVFNDVLNGEADMSGQGSDRAVTFLDEGYSIEISGMDSVQFAPYETTEVTELFPGQWIVGEDFPAGVYDLNMEETEELGSLAVYAHPEYQKFRYSLGSEEYGGMTSFTVSFEEGDVVELARIPTVTLTER